MKETKFDATQGIRVFGNDQEIENMLIQLTQDTTIKELSKIFPLYIRRVWLKKFLAHYELFSKIKGVEGDVVELGVFRGLSLFSFAIFNEFFEKKQRTIFGIDNFEGFSIITEEDGEGYDVPKYEGGFSPANYYEELIHLIEKFNKEAKYTQIKILKGNVEDVVYDFEGKQSNQLALIHFDVDIYIPTKIGLENLYPLLNKKGIMIFDEYSIIEWSGETKAVDEYFEDKDVDFKKLPWQGAPSAYIIKEYNE